MEKTIIIEKRIGKTPLEAIQEWKAANPAYADIPASYAGRLDPMASGKLLVLLGEECKKQDDYIGLDKEYEVEVLLGAGSDTGDILGIVSSAPLSSPSDSEVATTLENEIGTCTLPYPLYSSKTVAGKPLFLYALEGTPVEIPTHEETFYSIDLIGRESISTKELEEQILSLLALAPVSTEPSKALGADFRIKDVRASWDRVFSEERTYEILRLHVSCGSGAYMRSLAGRIGEKLGTNGLALSIHRARIGSSD